MTPGLAGVGHSEFEDPATLVDRPEQPRGIPVILIRPKSEHHPAPEKIGNSDAVVLTEVGMRVAVTTIINRARIAARATAQGSRPGRPRRAAARHIAVSAVLVPSVRALAAEARMAAINASMTVRGRLAPSNA